MSGDCLKGRSEEKRGAFILNVLSGQQYPDMKCSKERFLRSDITLKCDACEVHIGRG